MNIKSEMICLGPITDNKFRVVSFYTEIYKKFAIQLKNSLDSFHMQYMIRYLWEDYWTWKKACNYKAEFLLDCLEFLKSPVLWIDSDALIRLNLNYFNRLVDRDVDIGFHQRKGKELLSGTLFFNNTDKAKEILQLWKEESKKEDIWDQRNLQNALRKYDNKDLKIAYLPAGYCYFDLMKDEYNGPIYIEHFQASRQFNPEHPIYGKK